MDEQTPNHNLSHHNSVKFWIVLAVVFIIMLGIGFWVWLEPSTKSNTVTSAPLVKLTISGGLCAEGECRAIYTVDQNGNISSDDYGQKSSYVLTKAELAELRSLIEGTNYSEIRKNKFTELCPSAYDGSRVVYEFHTMHGVEKIDSCETVINSPVFSNVWQLTYEKLRRQ